MEIKPHQSLAFCEDIECDALELLDVEIRNMYCHRCYAYKIHTYLREHGQIFEEGSDLEKRIMELETENATVRTNNAVLLMRIKNLLNYRTVPSLEEKIRDIVLGSSSITGTRLVNELEQLRAVRDAAEECDYIRREIVKTGSCLQSEDLINAMTKLHRAEIKLHDVLVQSKVGD